MRQLLLLRIALFGSFVSLNHFAIAGPLTLATRNDTIPEVGTVVYTVATSSRNELTFLPPAGWKSSAETKTGTITWTSPDYRSMIQLKVDDDNGDAIPKIELEALKQKASLEMADARITEHSACYATGSTGIAFDSERLVDDKFPTTTRLAYIPVAGGFLQLNLTTPTEQFAKKQNELSRFLNSLRVTKLPAN